MGCFWSWVNSHGPDLSAKIEAQEAHELKVFSAELIADARPGAAESPSLGGSKKMVRRRDFKGCLWIFIGNS